MEDPGYLFIWYLQQLSVPLLADAAPSQKQDLGQALLTSSTSSHNADGGSGTMYHVSSPRLL